MFRVHSWANWAASAAWAVSNVGPGRLQGVYDFFFWIHLGYVSATYPSCIRVCRRFEYGYSTSLTMWCFFLNLEWDKIHSRWSTNTKTKASYFPMHCYSEDELFLYSIVAENRSTSSSNRQHIFDLLDLAVWSDPRVLDATIRQWEMIFH
jgi:hypothetical protein